LEQALRVDPTLILALQCRSEIELGLGRFDAALASARRMQSVSLTYGPGYYAEGSALYARALSRGPDRSASDEVRGDLESAQRALKAAALRASTLEDRFNAAFARGEIEMTLGVPRRAIGHYEEALEARPVPDEAGWFWRAQERRLKAYSAAGETDAARSLARDLRSRYASDARALAATQSVLP